MPKRCEDCHSYCKDVSGDPTPWDWKCSRCGLLHLSESKRNYGLEPGDGRWPIPRSDDEMDDGSIDSSSSYVWG